MSSSTEFMAAVKSKRERVAVATVLAYFCTLSKAQKTAFFGAANQLVFMSPRGRQKLFRDLEDDGIVPFPEDILNVAGEYIRSWPR